ncbi:zinc finger protein 26-like [Notolabrus celidotus]|uniref:zinc finger protein 26-like n=1 Tax=Notolabrus celidotus TaxID=1203425 RepID=UPI00148F77B8|nr:zinc finger protein 26-like [Notolabrus celidotus]
MEIFAPLEFPEGVEDDVSPCEDLDPDEHGTQHRKRLRTEKETPVRSARAQTAPSSLKKELLSCQVCGALYQSMNALVKHSGGHVDDPDRLCGVCGTRMETAEELRTHIPGHLERHGCHLCGKSFVLSSVLQAHIKRHNGVKPYECSVCNRLFTAKQKLTRHMKAHMRARLYPCDICRQEFRLMRKLRAHMAVHSKKNEDRCSVCCKSRCPYQKSSSHVLMNPGPLIQDPGRVIQDPGPLIQDPGRVIQDPGRVIQDPGPLIKEEFMCEVCRETFPTYLLLRYHTRTHRLTPYVCPCCGSSYITARLLTEHVLERHPESSSDHLTLRTTFRSNTA